MKCVLLKMYSKSPWMVFSLFITATFSLEIKFTEFVRDSTLNNFVCSKEDTVFEKTGVTETVCAVGCQLFSGCRSIFYVPLSMDCTGCTKVYATNDMLLSSAGSQHYTTKDTGWYKSSLFVFLHIFVFFYMFLSLITKHSKFMPFCIVILLLYAYVKRSLKVSFFFFFCAPFYRIY